MVQRKCILIIGMHRSGTSALSGALSKLDVSLGKEIMSAAPENVKGFFENVKVKRLNDELLKSLNTNWHTPFANFDQSESNLENSEFIPRIIDVINEEFGEHKNILIKDPRISILFPYWKIALEQLGFKIEVLFAIRSFDAIAQSLKKRNSFSYGKSVLVSMHYLLSGEKATRGTDRMFVSYDQLIKAPIKVLKSIINKLKIDEIKLTKEQSTAVIKFLDKKLDHYNQGNKPSNNFLLKERNKIESIFQKAIEGKNLDKRNIVQLDQIKSQLDVLSSNYFEGLLHTNERKLSIKFFNKEHKLVGQVQKKVSLGGNLVVFKVPKKLNASYLRLFPIENYCNVSIQSLEYLNEDKFVRLNQMRSYSILEHGTQFIMGANNFVQFDLEKVETTGPLSLNIHYNQFGIRVLDAIEKLGIDISQWFYQKIETIETHSKEIEKSLKEELHHSKANEQSLTDNVASLQNTISSLKREKAEIASNLENHNEVLFDQKLKLRELEIKLDFEGTKKEGIQSEIQNINNQLENAKSKLEETLKQNSLLKKESTEVKKNFEHLSLQFKETEDQLLKTQLKNKELAQLQIESKKQSNKKTKSFENELKSSKKELTKTKKKHKKSQAEILALGEELKQLSEQLSKVQIEKDEKLAELGANNDLLKTQLEELTQIRASLDDSLTKSTHEKNEFASSLAEVQQKHEEAQNNVTLLQQWKESMEHNYELKEKELEEKQHELSKKIEQLGYLESNNAEILHISKNLEQKQEELLAKISQNDQKIQHFEKENAELYAKIESYKSDLINYENIISESHFQQDHFKKLIVNRDLELDAIKKSISYKLGFGFTWPGRKIFNLVNKDKPINDTKFWLLYNMLNNGVQHPGKMLSSINKENLETLRSALQKENPSEIAENLEKFLQTSKITEAPSENIETKELEITEHTVEDAIIEKAESAYEHDDVIEKPKVLYISPNLPDFDTSSGGKRATRMIHLLQEQFDVYIFTLGAKPQKYIDKLESSGAIVINNFSFRDLKKRIKDFKAIIFSFYYCYYDYNKFIGLYPNAKIIVDTVDVHWVREERSIGIWEGLTEEKVAANKKREIEAYRNADLLWTVTENDKQYLINEIPEANVKVVSNVHQPITVEYQDPGNNNMLFIGGYNHYPNISAVKMVVREILPKVRQSHPDAKLIIAGANAPDDIKELGNLPGVEFKGFIPEEEMDDLYANTFISVSPVLAGAGIKGKICEAISYMVPVATNTLGNEGVNLVNGESGVISDDSSQMAQGIIELMHRNTSIGDIAKNAQSNLYKLVGPDVVQKRMFNSILPEVSICIVTWNRIDLLKRCIESIEGNTKYPNYKILVHSNGCEDGTQEYLTAASSINKKIIPILSKENEVFVKPNNNMMKMFPENDVVLVNNDVYVTENWLYALYDAAYASNEIGFSGSKILYPDGRLQEYGSELYEDGTGRNIGKFDDPDKPEFKKIRYVGYVSGCSLYIKRSTIEKVGMFDEQFHPCYCEDSDLCYTGWENGLGTVVTPHSIIFHDEGGTSGTDENTGFKAYQKVNFEKFLNKHKKNLKSIQNKIEQLN